MSATRPRWFALLSAGALFTYAVVVLPGLAIGPITLRMWHTAILLVPGWLVLAASTKRLAQGRSADRLLDIGAASLSVLLALLVADTALRVWINLHAPGPAMTNFTYERESDAAIWHGELYPRPYHPTNLDFVLYKPNTSSRGFTYGQFYEHRLLASPLLRDSVLQYRKVEYDIDNHGLRGTSALADTRIYALGDSYVFGYATDVAATLCALLEKRIGRRVYNMGISGAGPMQEVQLLQHMLSLHSDSMHIEHLLWVIYEGNDLENSYVVLRPLPKRKMAGFDSTVVAAFAGMPRLLREQSAFHRLVTGKLSLHPPDSAYVVDGIALRTPLYHSQRFGYRLFSPVDIASAAMDSMHVWNHTHAKAAAATVATMKAMSQRYGFKVTVVLAPSDARLYAKSFKGLPEIPAKSYVLDYFSHLAKEAGFDVVDLATLMAPYAENELLYYRDDHHWNARGNAIAAQLIAESVAF